MSFIKVGTVLIAISILLAPAIIFLSQHNSTISLNVIEETMDDTYFDCIITSLSFDEQTTWDYTIQVDITNPIANYSMELYLYKESGSDSPADKIFYLNNNCHDFPNDIRFGSTGNETSADMLPQWLESSDNNMATYWIHTRDDNYSQFFIFAGNSDAKLRSDGSDVFTEYDNHGYYFVNSTATFLDNTLAIKNGTRPYASGTGITKLANGSFVCFYNSGVASANGNYRIFQRYSHDNGTTWGEAYQTMPIGAQGSWSIIMGIVGTSPNGTIIVATIHWHSRSNSPQYMYQSFDNGFHWETGVNNNIPYVYTGASFPLFTLPNGTMIVGADCDIGLPDPGKWNTYLSYSDNNGSTWNPIGLMNKPTNADIDETTWVRLSNGTIYQRCRSNCEKIYHSWSENGGFTWGQSAAMDIPNGKAPQNFLRYSDEPNRIIFFTHNNTYSDWQVRKPMNVTVSYNDAVGWANPQRQVIDKAYATCYAHTVKANDGDVLLNYWDAPDAIGGTNVMKIPGEWFWATYWDGDVSDVTSTSVYNDGVFTLSGNQKHICTTNNYQIPFVLEIKSKVSDDSNTGAIIGFGDTPGTTAYLPVNGCAYMMDAPTPTISTRVNNVWHGNHAATASLPEYQIRKFVVTSTSIKVYYNDTLDVTMTTNLPSGDMAVWISSVTGTDTSIDWMFIRPYDEDGPTFGGASGFRFMDFNYGQANNSMIYVRTPAFNWTIESDAYYYQLQISDSKEFSNILVNLTDICSTNYPIEYSEGTYVTFVLPDAYALDNSKDYYFRLRYKQSGGR